MFCYHQFEGVTCQALIPSNQQLCKFHKSVKSKINSRKIEYNWLKTFRPSQEESLFSYKELIWKDYYSGYLSIYVVDYIDNLFRDVNYNFILSYNDDQSLKVIGVLKGDKIETLTDDDKEIASNLELYY